jgi:hypothetical protein
MPDSGFGGGRKPDLGLIGKKVCQASLGTFENAARLAAAIPESFGKDLG